AEGFARSAQRHRIRYDDRGAGLPADLLPRRSVGVVLPTASHLIRAGGAGLARGRAHAHAGDVAALAAERSEPRAPRTLADAPAQASLPTRSARVHQQTQDGRCYDACLVRADGGDGTPARRRVSPELQRDRLLNALGRKARYVARSDEPHHDTRE